MSTESLSINGGEVNDTLILLGDGSNLVGKLGALLSSLGKDISKWNASLNEERGVSGN